jgi:uncharacterized protein (TIGR00369 family)
MQLFGAEIPFASVCGIEPVDAEGGRTRLRVQVRPEQANNLGIAHGGLLCTMLDIAMGTAARVTTGAGAVMTLNMHTSFLAPGRGELTAEGTVLRAGSSVIFCQAEIRSQDGTLVATASGVFKPVRTRE